VPEDRLLVLRGGETLDGWGRDGPWHVAYTPGHAQHHVSYLHEPSATVYAGDVAGARAALNQAIQSPDKADYYRLSALAQAADLDEQSGNVKAALRTYRDLIENATDPA